MISIYSVSGIKQFFSSFPVKLFCVMTVVAGSYGCKKFVQVDTPPNLLLSKDVYADSATVVATLNGMYEQMRDNGLMNGLVNNQMSFCADELVNYSTTPTIRWLFYQNAVLSTTAGLNSFWHMSYSQIYITNTIIEGINQSSTISMNVRNQAMGEALFVRGLLHFYLVNLFGNIPYADTTDYMINTKRSRLPQAEVYSRILADVHEAESLLSVDYPTGERARVNQSVAKALLARIHLYVGNWEKSAQLAGEVIDRDDLYQLQPELDKVFLKESPETIWQFRSIDQTNTDEGNMAILVSSPIPNGQSLSETLIAAFEPGDQRRVQWIGEYSNATNTWYYAYKYKQKYSSTPSLEYPVLFRLAEQYLIRAEALAQQNNIEEALSYLNAIRNRAGLEDVEADTKEDALEAIYHERQVELFYECAHRWYDLKRTGRANTILSAVKSGWNATDTLLPVPETELLVNPNLLPQNAGYN